MKNWCSIPVLLATVMVLVTGLFIPLAAQEKRVTDSALRRLPQPLKVEGYLRLNTHPGHARYVNNIYLKNRTNAPVRGIVCTIEGRGMRENGPGAYTLDIAPASPMSGILDVAINKPVKGHSNPGYFPVTGTCAMGNLLRITSPAPGSSINSATTRNLVVSWSGRDVYAVIIRELLGETPGATVVNRTVRGGTRISIPIAMTLKHKKTYRLLLVAKPVNFTLVGRTLPGSYLRFEEHSRLDFQVI